MTKSNTLLFALYILIPTLWLAGCGGAVQQQSSGRDQVKSSTQQENISDASLVEKPTETKDHSQSVQDTIPKRLPSQVIYRKWVGDSVQIKLNTDFSYRTYIDPEQRTMMNRIREIAPGVLLYEKYPKERSSVFYHSSQPMKVEWINLETGQSTTYNIWENRPYRPDGDTKFTYFHANAETMSAYPAKQQDASFVPDEYSLLTHVKASGDHVIINYELLSIKDGYKIIGVKNTIHILDNKGKVVAKVKDLSSYDGGAVTPDGKYLMYVFGGNVVGAHLHEQGWALMDLSNQNIVYKEFKKKGASLNGISTNDPYTKISYSYPRSDSLFRYRIFFDFKERVIYKKVLDYETWERLESEFDISNGRGWEYCIEKFHFDTIKISPE